MKKKKKKSGDFEDCFNKKLVVKPSDESTSHEESVINHQEPTVKTASEEQQRLREAILKCLKS
jgi:hypothetical protein